MGFLRFRSCCVSLPPADTPPALVSAEITVGIANLAAVWSVAFAGIDAGKVAVGCSEPCEAALPCAAFAPVAVSSFPGLLSSASASSGVVGVVTTISAARAGGSASDSAPGKGCACGGDAAATLPAFSDAYSSDAFAFAA